MTNFDFHPNFEGFQIVLEAAESFGIWYYGKKQSVDVGFQVFHLY